MNMSMVPARSSPLGALQTTGLACVAITLAAWAAYHNSFSREFIFDDLPSIVDNPTIRHLGSALSPPVSSATAGGRPVTNLTFALNYALGGLNPWGYHAFNLLVHTLAGLALFGVVRRTLLRPVLRGRFGTDAMPLALAVAMLWTVHPLQTESVTYIVQRAESLMGLFYLLTLYCFIRGVEKRSQESGVRSQEKRSGFRPLATNLWPLASICCCLLGMASKEVMASAPLIVLLYDRTFVAGTFLEAWKTRRQFYAGLAATWLLLGALVAGTQGRGGSAGFGTDVSSWSYALTQFLAIVHYLRLSLWPDSLVFDYGTTLATRAADIVPCAAIVLLLVAATAYALWRRPAIGFAGCWFFAILAPSSSVMPVSTQTMAEHRMYLPLAAVITLGVLGLYALIGPRSLIVFAVAAVGLGWMTTQRNKDYRSELAIWSDTAAKRPGNERAHSNLGVILASIPGQLPESIRHLETAVRLKPDFADAHYNLGASLGQAGRMPEAIVQLEAALQLKPDYAEAHNSLGSALANIPGRMPEAMGHFEMALRLKPDYAEARNNLGLALKQVGRIDEAISQFEAALRLKPDYAEAHYNLGTSLGLTGRVSEAISQFEEAVRLRPDYVEAHYNLGACLGQAGRIPEAIVQFEDAVRLRPDFAEAHGDLGLALYKARRIPEAIAQCNAALRIKPDFAPAHALLEQIQAAAK